MKNTGKKLIALMLSVMMLLGLIPALAETPAQDNAFAKILASGKNLKTEVTVTVNPMLGALVSSFSGSQPTEESQAVFQKISDAIAKIKATFIASATAASGSFGTEQGELADLQVSYKEDGSDLKMTSSLLPNVFLTIAPEMMAQYASIQEGQNMGQELVLEKSEPYIDVLNAEIGKLQEAVGVQTGSFETPYGAFTNKTELTLTTHMVANIVIKLGEVYEKDTELQEMVQQLGAANQQMSSEMGIPTGVETQETEETPAAPKDPILDLVASAKGALETEDKPLNNVVIYDDGADRAFIDMFSLKEDPQQMNIKSFVDTGKSTGASKVEVKVIIAGPQMPVEGQTEPAPIDWLALEQAIKTGQDEAGQMVEVLVNAVKDGETKVKSDLSFAFISRFISAGLAVNSDINLETMESLAELSLSMMMPDPLLKVSIKSMPTDEQPVAQEIAENAKEIVLKEELSEEDQAILKEAGNGIKAKLGENLKKALPEEAPVIIELIKSMMQPAAQDMPEPHVDEAQEPVTDNDGK